MWDDLPQLFVCTLYLITEKKANCDLDRELKSSAVFKDIVVIKHALCKSRLKHISLLLYLLKRKFYVIILYVSCI